MASSETPAAITGAAPPLEGWDAIASHLRVSKRTVQRWARAHPMPLQRSVRAGVERVSASQADLDRWLEEHTSVGTLDASSANSPPEVDLASPRRHTTTRRMTIRALVVLATSACSALAGFALGRSTHAVLPDARPMLPVNSPPSNIVGDTRGQLIGRIVIDANGNGQWDAGESFAEQPGRECQHAVAMTGFRVEWEAQDAEWRGATAAMNCNPEPFYHVPLPPGRYRVRLRWPAGWRSTSADTAEVDVETGRDTHAWFAVASASEN